MITALDVCSGGNYVPHLDGIVSSATLDGYEYKAIET